MKTLTLTLTYSDSTTTFTEFVSITSEDIANKNEKAEAKFLALLDYAESEMLKTNPRT